MRTPVCKFQLVLGSGIGDVGAALAGVASFSSVIQRAAYTPGSHGLEEHKTNKQTDEMPRI